MVAKSNDFREREPYFPRKARVGCSQKLFGANQGEINSTSNVLWVYLCLHSYGSVQHVLVQSTPSSYCSTVVVLTQAIYYVAQQHVLEYQYKYSSIVQYSSTTTVEENYRCSSGGNNIVW